MNYRAFGRTGWSVSEVGFGAWAIGGDWGRVSDSDAREALHAALDEGVNVIDTADVYGDGRSERIISEVLGDREHRVYVFTKLGRRLQPHVAGGYNRPNLTRFVERSLSNLRVEALDLVQLHCPPTEVYYMPEVFSVLDGLVTDGKVRHYGVSVEKVEEAIKALGFPGVQSVQIIFNILRLRPSELFFELARRHSVAILARVPLASGLLSGKMSRDRAFAADDHRHFNRKGEAFDVGETFSGVGFENGLAAVERIRPMVPAGWTMAQLALRWILMFSDVTTVIPGAKDGVQARENARSSEMPPLDRRVMEDLEGVYREFAREQVHHRW